MHTYTLRDSKLHLRHGGRSDDRQPVGENVIPKPEAIIISAI